MALLYLELNILDNYKLLIRDIIKYLTILIVFHYLMTSTKLKNPFRNGFLNKNFVTLLMYLILGILFYYLIIEELINVI
jgi:hypothetical protein